MYVGSKADARKLANRTQFPVYLSLREPNDSLFGVVNTKVIPDHIYNTTIKKAEEGVNYLVVLPDGKSGYRGIYDTAILRIGNGQ